MKKVTKPHTKAVKETHSAYRVTTRASKASPKSDVTQQLNRVYATESSELDLAFVRVQATWLTDETW